MASEATKTCFGDWPNDSAFVADTEQRGQGELSVHGEFPSILAGTLYRTGPGRRSTIDAEKREVSLEHWFDGLTVIHRFEIIPTVSGSCKVIYNSREQVDEALEKSRQSRALDGFTFAQKRDPCMNFFQKLKSVFEPKLLYADGHGIYNIGVTLSLDPSAPAYQAKVEDIDPSATDRHLVARTDAAITKAIEPDTLEPIGVTSQQSLHPSLTGWMSASHAQIDPITGDIYNFNLSFNLIFACTYRVFCTSRSTGKTEILAIISERDVLPAYIHSFFMTDDFVILCVWNSYFAAGGAKVLWERNLIDAISPFDPRATTKWLVVDRKHGRGLVAKFDSPAIFSFHTVNAWQERNPSSSPSSSSDAVTDVNCDIIQYPSLDVIHRFYYDNLISTGSGVSNWAGNDIDRSSQKPSLVRYKLSNIPLDRPSTRSWFPPWATTTTSSSPAQQLLQFPTRLVGDLPMINPHYRFRKHRYVYTLCDRGLSSFVDGIAKLDIDTGLAVYWGTRNHTPGEAIFVPKHSNRNERVEETEKSGQEDWEKSNHRGEGDDEDEGYLLSVVFNGDTGTSYLLCLDAKSMTEVGRAEAEMAVPSGFHGIHTTRT